MGLALLLLLAPATKTAYAYFTDYEAARGGAVIRLGGETHLEEEVKEGNKTVVISNTGDTDLVVRVMILGNADYMTVDPGKDWQEGTDGAWYYTAVLAAGEDTTAINVNVKTGPGEAAENQDFDITVVHEASRVIYETTGGKEQVKQPAGWDGMPAIVTGGGE